MKTIRLFLTSILFFIGVAANAQSIDIYKNGAVIKSYSIAEVDSVVYKPAPSIESSTKILIGDISIGQEIGDALYGDPNGPGEFMTNAQNVSSILTDAIIQQNIDAGNLKVADLQDYLSVYSKNTITNDGWNYLEFSSIKDMTLPTQNMFTYHCVLIPTSISDDYFACWINDGSGASFNRPDDNYASIMNKTVSFNNEEYSMSGYYVDMAGQNGTYNLSIVKKIQ